MDIFMEIPGVVSCIVTEINSKCKEPLREFSAAWDSWSRKWTHVWKGQIIRRRTHDDTVPRCRAPKTLAHHLLLTPMPSINILELMESQEEAAIAVLCILSPSPDLLSACPHLAGCHLCVEFESVPSGMVDIGIIFFWPNTYPFCKPGCTVDHGSSPLIPHQWLHSS